MNTRTLISSYILRYFEIQGVITCISLPFLISWGLPCSTMSFVGNFFGTPLITLFLGLSTILFITELCSIPNYYCVQAVEFVSKGSMYFLNKGSKQWLIALPKTSLLISLSAVGALLIIYNYRSYISQLTRTLLVLSCCFFPFIYNSVFSTKIDESSLIPSKQLYLTCNQQNEYTLHDDGCFSRQLSPEKYVQFEVRPFLIKQLGTISLNTLELHRFNRRALKAAQALCTLCSISKIVIHKGSKEIPKYTWRTYYELKRAFNTLSIKIINN